MKKFLFEVSFAAFMFLLSYLATKLVGEPYLPPPFSFIPGVVIIWVVVKASGSDGFKRGEKEGYEDGYPKGLVMGVRASAFEYNAEEGGLEEHLFYKTWWSLVLSYGKHLNVVEAISGPHQTMYRLVISPRGALPDWFIYRNGMAQEITREEAFAQKQ